MLLSLLLPSAFAVSLEIGESIAVAGWPTGLLSVTTVGPAIPLYRSDSVVFQDTKGSLRARLRGSPAFVEPGIELAVQPIDVFTLDVGASYLWYPDTPFGLEPFDELSGTRGSVRSARAAAGEVRPSRGWTVYAEPTVQLKVGPIIGFDSATIERRHIDPIDATAPYLYEPYWDLVMAPDDTVVEQLGVVLYTVVPAKEDGAPFFWAGASVRDRFTLVSRDHSTGVGPVVVTKLSRSKAVPALLGLCQWYVRDNDFLGPVPFLAVRALWNVEVPLGAKGP